MTPNYHLLSTVSASRALCSGHYEYSSLLYGKQLNLSINVEGEYTRFFIKIKILRFSNHLKHAWLDVADSDLTTADRKSVHLFDSGFSVFRIAVLDNSESFEISIGVCGQLYGINITERREELANIRTFCFLNSNSYVS